MDESVFESGLVVRIPAIANGTGLDIGVVAEVLYGGGTEYDGKAKEQIESYLGMPLTEVTMVVGLTESAKSK